MLRSVSLPEEFTPGNLYLSSMPGRFEPLEVFLEEIAEASVTNVLCLVSDVEIARKSPDYLTAIQGDDLPATLWRFEIPDYGMPENVTELDQILDLLRKRLDAGESLVIHCAYGHGRTGMVSTLLLTRMGMLLEKAAETVRLAGSSPDTAMQQEFLRSRAGS